MKKNGIKEKNMMSGDKGRRNERGMESEDGKCRRERRKERNKSNRVRTTDAFSGELPAYLSLNRL